MSRNHLAKLCCVLSLLLGGRVLAASSADAEAFIARMLTAVEARRVECHPEVLRDTKTREMEAVCAVFEGSFESFEARWARSLRSEIVQVQDEPGERDRVRPLTRWELNEGTHERIYAVGRAALGVRFTGGRILIAYR